MPRPRKDQNRTAAKAVAKITKTKLPKGEDLLGSVELKRRLAGAKKGSQRG